MNIQFYVAANPGYGHLYRSLALARELNKRGHCIGFKMTRTQGTMHCEQKVRIAMSYFPAYFEGTPDWWVIDENGPHAEWPSGAKVCYLNGFGDPVLDGPAAEQADLAVCMGVKLKPTAGNWLEGFQYVPIWPELAKLRGYPAGEYIFTYSSANERIAKFLPLLQEETGRPLVIPSGGNRADRDLASALVALLPWGLTAMEACYLGVPQVVVSHNDGEAASAEGLARQGALRHFRWDDLDVVTKAVGALVDLISEKSIAEYQVMSRCAMNAIDGFGASRIAEAIEVIGED